MGLKVLMLGPYPYESGKIMGGVESVVGALTNSLSRSSDISHLTVFDFFRGPQPSKFEKISDKLDVFHYPAQRRLALPTRGWLDYRKIKSYCREFKPDIIHGQGIDLAGDLAIRLGANSVVSVHGMIHLEARMALSASFPDRWRIRLTDGMLNRILSRARVVISTSSYDFNSLKNLITGRHVLIGNPVDELFFEHQRAVPENQTALFAGVMTRRKNVAGLLRAFDKVRCRIPSARLVIVGPCPDADYYQEIRAIMVQLDLENAVEFRGFLENRELIACLAQSRCLVLFSNEETSPTIIAQAMAMGKPIVATRVGGIPELVQEGKGGFLVNAGDEEALSERLIRILTADDQVREMGGYNRQIAVGRSSPGEVARRTIQEYHLAAGG